MTLNMEKQSFDSIIEQHFPKDIQQKRIRKELLSLNELDKEAFKINLLNSTLGLKVIVEISPQLFEENPKIHDNLNFPIIIELLLDPQFPFNLPKLFCQTNIYEPSLADARDFLEDTIEKPWSPTILLREVINTVPNFLSKMALLENPLESQSYGKYHVGELYNLEDLLGYENIVLFSAEEIIAKKKQIPRYLMVAESYFLIFEIVDKTKNILRLFDSTKIQSIINLKKGKEEDKTLAFTFIDKERQGGVAQYKFILNEATELLELLIAKGQKYGVKISGAVKKKLDISYYSSRITLPVDEDNIEETLEDIEELERRVEKDVSKDVVYTLMAYYQKVVEHFAVYDDDSVGDFVKRLRNLMEREDVQNTLKNTPEEQPKNNKVLTKKLTEDTDIDEEEKKDGNDQPFSWPEKENEFIVGNSPKFEGREQREEIFIGGNRGGEHKVEERVKKANLPNAEEEWGQYEENTTKEDQAEHGEENVKIGGEDKGNGAHHEPEQHAEQINRENDQEEENREENIEFKQEAPEEQNENKEEENLHQPQEDVKNEHVENKEVTEEREEEIVKHEETEKKEVVNEENVGENRHEEEEKQEENLPKQEENQTQEGVEQTAHKEEEILEQNKEVQDHNNQVISNEENIHKEEQNEEEKQNNEEVHQQKEEAAHEEGQTQQEEQNKEEIIEEKKIEDQVVEEKQGEQIEEHKEENIKGENNQEEENNEDKEDGEENESPQKGEEGAENEENKDKKKKKKKSNKKKKN